MKILVTGGAGFIGSALVRALVAAGHQVSGAVRMFTPQPTIAGVQYVQADLICRDGWDAALFDKPEIVYACAGKTGGSGLDPLHFVTDNALIALHMYRSCAEAGVRRIVYLSSTTGYPDLGGIALPEELYFDGQPHPAYFNPGHTKRFIERLGQMWAHKLETVCVRVAGVYGPGSDFDPQTSHVIEATIRKVAERHNPILLWGDGHARRDAVHISDFIDGLLRCMDWPAGAYNFATGAGMSVNSMLHTLLAHSGHECRVERDLSKPQMIAARLLDCSKARAFGWTPYMMMPQGLRDTFDWYKAQQ